MTSAWKKERERERERERGPSLLTSRISRRLSQRYQTARRRHRKTHWLPSGRRVTAVVSAPALPVVTVGRKPPDSQSVRQMTASAGRGESQEILGRSRVWLPLSLSLALSAPPFAKVQSLISRAVHSAILQSCVKKRDNSQERFLLGRSDSAAGGTLPLIDQIFIGGRVGGGGKAGAGSGGTRIASAPRVFPRQRSPRDRAATSDTLYRTVERELGR